MTEDDIKVMQPVEPYAHMGATSPQGRSLTCWKAMLQPKPATDALPAWHDTEELGMI